MVRPIETREQRLATLLEGFQHVPAIVQDRLSTAFLEADLTPRGMPKALTRFYAHLETAGRTSEQVATEDFETLSSSRTAHRTLLTALRKFAPEVPLAAARPVSQHWDNWLNSRYNQKAKKLRRSTRVALVTEDWPEVWQSVIPALDRVVRVDGHRFRKLASKTTGNVIQAIGMLGAALIWAQERGVDLDETF